MRKVFAIFLTVVLLLGLCACGKSGQKTGTDDSAVESSDFSQVDDNVTDETNEDDNDLGDTDSEDNNDMSDDLSSEKHICEDGNLGDYHIEVIGAEDLGETALPLIRFYYEFTNNSDETVSSGDFILVEAFQDGVNLNEDSTRDDVDEYWNEMYAVRPGSTIRCIRTFRYDSEGGEVSVELSNWQTDENECVVASFDAANLPGAPTDPWVPSTVADPTWTNNLESTGTVEGLFISIDSMEEAAGEFGDDCVRVYLTMTNDSEYSVYASVPQVNAFQDGVMMTKTLASNAPASDNCQEKEILPGENLVVSYVFVKYSDSPVEVEVCDFFKENRIGNRFP